MKKERKKERNDLVYSNACIGRRGERDSGVETAFPPRRNQQLMDVILDFAAVLFFLFFPF